MTRRSPRLAGQPASTPPHRAARVPALAVAPGGRSGRAQRTSAQPPPASTQGGDASRVVRRLAEPDEELEPEDAEGSDSDEPVVVDAGAPKPSGDPLAGLPFGAKPKRSHLPTPPFSGRVEHGNFDSGVHAHWKRFKKDLLSVQLLEGKRFTDAQCLALFFLCLEGDAELYMANVHRRQPDLTLEDAGQILIKRFSSMLPTSTIIDKIRTSTKARDETYQRFAIRLLEMAEALPGGTTVETNARVVLETFVEKAYWRFSAQLGGFVRDHLQRNPNPLDALDAAVQELTQIARSDGVQVLKPKLTDPQPSA